MSTQKTKAQRKQEAVAQRQNQEQAEQRSARKRKLAVIIGGAAAVVAVVIALSVVGGSDSSKGGDASSIVGAGDIATMFEGVPVNGWTVGRQDAPVTFVEYFDLRCPYCGQFARDIYPTILQNYVRTGKVKVQLRPMGFLGPQSTVAAAAAVQAEKEGHGPQFVELFFRNQGNETDPYVTSDFITSLAKSVPSLNPAKVLAASQSPSVGTEELDANIAAFTAAGLQGTPGFQLGNSGTKLKTYQPRSLTLDTFVQALDTATKDAK